IRAGRDAEQTARLVLQAAHGALRSFDLVDNAKAVIEVRPPGVGQAELSRRALEQARVQPLLEVGDFSADGRLRHPERLRRRGEAPGLNDTCEYRDFVQIHSLLSHSWDSFAKHA